MANSKIDNIWNRAKDIVSRHDRVNQLLEDVKIKLGKVEQDSEERSKFMEQIFLVSRMIKAHFQGTYRSFSMMTMLMLVFGLVYFITPLDLIPDFIPALGFTDDISLIYMILKNLGEDIENFKAFEEQLNTSN